MFILKYSDSKSVSGKNEDLMDGSSMEELFGVDFVRSQTSPKEVIDLIRQLTEEAKKRYPDKKDILDEVQIEDTGRSIGRLALDYPTTMQILVSAGSTMMILTWKDVVIPLIQRRLKIGPWKEEGVI